MCEYTYIEKKAVQSFNIDTIERNKKTYFLYAWKPYTMAETGWQNK